MSKILVKFFNNGLVVVITAILGGMISMALLYLLFTTLWGGQSEADPQQQVSSIALEEEKTAPIPESFFLSAQEIPAPFLSRNDGSVLGYVFLDVTIEIKGEEAYIKGEQSLDNIIQTFASVLMTDGVGKARQPGLVDYERLTKTLQAVAGDAVGPEYVAGVTITGSDGG